MRSHDADVIVVGAGIIGLAVARAIALCGRTVLIVERERQVGAGVSARSSGVIHAGLYYPAGSLKSRLCIAGRSMLYRFCAENRISHRGCGKLIVACAPQELPQLLALHRNAERTLGSETMLLDRAAVRRLEPELDAVAAILSPQTGIVDVPALMEALRRHACGHGAVLRAATEVAGIHAEEHWTDVVLAKGEQRLRAFHVVNAAALEAPRLAATHGAAPMARFAKGSYFALRGRAPFERLIYPLPPSDGLGIHLTLDLQGRTRFGPDVEWIDQPDYTVDPSRAPIFYQAIHRYWPGLQEGALEPAYAGVRPKLGPGENDFRIERLGRLINLFGIDSPGITAALAIGRHVADLIEGGPVAPNHSHDRQGDGYTISNTL